MELKIGRYYKDSKGNKCGPMRKRTDGLWGYVGSNSVFWINGSSCHSDTPSLVSEWIEPKAEPKPFGELSDVEQGALLLAGYKGENIENSTNGVDWYQGKPLWLPMHIYRIGPTRITGTVELINGEPDFTTWEKSDD
jgi:hypothetical protein